VDLLKHLCEDILDEQINNQSALRLYNFSSLYNAPNLKSACIGYIQRNESSIAAAPEWTKLTDEQRNEVLTQICIANETIQNLERDRTIVHVLTVESIIDN